MFEKIDRQQIRAACRFYGGIKAVADKAHVDDGNLSRWLRGQPTLADEKVADVLSVLGIQNERPDRKRVHAWHLKSIPADFADAIKFYFPERGNLITVFEVFTLDEMLEKYQGSDEMPFGNVRVPGTPCRHFISDTKTRAILHLPTNIRLKTSDLKGTLDWFDGEYRINEIKNKTFARWADGIPSITSFDAFFRSIGFGPLESDVINAIENEGITFKEAIRRIQKGK